MKIIITKDYEEASRKAAEILIKQIKDKPDSILGLATGATPIGLYRYMVADHEANGTSYKALKTYNLDEYVGLTRDHPQSYYHFMNEHLFSKVDIDPEHTHVPHGDLPVDEACEAYNARLANNTRDLQLLGIGSNGHIGFNEPGSSFDSHVHCVDLKESTIQDNARLFFDGDINAVPKQAITMGIADVMAAKKVLIMASGKGKAKAVKAMIEDEISNEVPATILQKHPDVVVVLDEDAASLLTK